MRFPKVYRQPTNGGFSALGAADSVGKGLPTLYRQDRHRLAHVWVASVRVGNGALDAKPRSGIDRKPLVGMSVRSEGV